MDRRDFLIGMLSSSAVGALGCAGAASPSSDGLQVGSPGATAPNPIASGVAESESRRALRDLVGALNELDARWVPTPDRIRSPFDESDAYRNLMHLLEDSLLRAFEADPEWPVFQRMVTPTRKYLGDNPDAIYFSAFVRGDRRYRIRGNLSGATYTSFTVEYGDAPGEMSKGVASVLNDSQFEVAPDGAYEIQVGSKPPHGHRGWLELPANAIQISTRHYFERERSAAADPDLHIPLVIEPLDSPLPPPTFDDGRTAAGIRRVTSQLRAKAAMSAVNSAPALPAWVSTKPNVFNPPASPGDIAYTALDAAYTMAPYALAPDEALVITGRFPKCRFANVVVWNAYQMSYDYAHRSSSRNRKQTVLEPDGSFRIVLAHADPGVPNWIDTEGRPSGIVFWRFFLPEERPLTPVGRVVKLTALRART